MNKEWYTVTQAETIDSPALLVYPDRIKTNIRRAIDMVGKVSKLRPHVKTNKMEEVCSLMMEAGIRKFKCATIAEAEMLALAGAEDVLLAYQPTGPKVDRLINLTKIYSGTRFSCLVDNEESAAFFVSRCRDTMTTMDVFIDLNVGMDRTGVHPSKAVALADYIQVQIELNLRGIHAYDGHIHDHDPEERRVHADQSYALAEQVYQAIQPKYDYSLLIVMGGTPTFPMHLNREHCELSPGTFVFWDWGYRHMLEDLPFEYAALVMGRVISIIDAQHICVDIGYKSVASESPLPRIHFLNAPEAVPTGHSEEHLVLEVPDSGQFPIGMVMYGVPVHICPTVALYDRVSVILHGHFTEFWLVTARNRYINI